MRFKFTGTVPGELASGRPVAFGDVVSLSRSEVAANRRLIDEGQLALMPRRSPAKPKTGDSDR